MRQVHAPPKVYEWNLKLSGACGVSVNKTRALRDLYEAVLEARPGDEGTLHESVLGFHTEYYRLRTLGMIVHDAATGFIAWRECR